jgi:ketosteroid isomerase-like protein
MSACKVAQRFFDRMQAGEVDEILRMVTPDAAVFLVSLQVQGLDGGRGRGVPA